MSQPSIMASNFLKLVADGDSLLVRRATRDNRNGDAPDWSDYGGPHVIIAYVQRRTKAYKERGKIHPVGELLELTVKNGNWAGHSEQDFSKKHCTFNTENYYMEVIQWNGVDVKPDPDPNSPLPTPTRITISMDEYNRLKSIAGEQ